MARVVVVGGGNAGLCAAMAARDRGAEVAVLERAPIHLRGGNSRHTRNLRTAHDQGDDFLSGAYPASELRADLVALAGGEGDEAITDLIAEEAGSIAAWMEDHGARWQGALRGTLSLTRTNRFFLGGGKALINAYYRTLESLGVDVRYDAKVIDLEVVAGRALGVILDGDRGQERIACDALVLAAGGFEANLDWLAQHWGPAAYNFAIRGTPHNDGLMLERLFAHGANRVGDPTRFHAVAVDARGPRFDGGIVTRLDAIPAGIVVNCRGERFADEGEDLWPKRYATWGRRIALEEEQQAFAIIDRRRRGAIMPPVYAPHESATIEGLANAIGVSAPCLAATVATFNAHAPAEAGLDLDALDGHTTTDLDPPKSNWALRIEEPPFYAFPLRPGITFTYHGVAVDRSMRVRRDGTVFDNVFAAGEMMAGNVLTSGYMAGIGMTIGSISGRLAGWGAADA